MASYERGETKPDSEAIAAYVEKCNVDPEWLLLGRGEMLRNNALVKVSASSVVSDFINLPLYDVRASAGPGLVNVEEVQTGMMSFEYRWLRDLGVNPDSAVIISAEGDSMDPTIPDGAAMVVDRSKRDIKNGCIYVFNVDGDLIVKRVERLIDRTINLISDNIAKYPVRSIASDDAINLNVVGRVFYVGRPV
jgi:phage repressor protein C with HTH and peptisase S24 domain